MAGREGKDQWLADIGMPVVLGSAAGLLVAVLSMGMLGNVAIVVLSVAAGIVAFIIRRRGLTVRMPRRPARAPLMRSHAPRPPSDMLKAAVGFDPTRPRTIEGRVISAGAEKEV